MAASVKMNSMQSIKRVEICGGIASGKTTLANLLARLGHAPLLENFKINPFWETFYTNIGKYVFETELSFMLQHYHEIKKALPKEERLACDHSFELDKAYAMIGLSGSQLQAFISVYNEIKKDIPPAGLIVHLQCDAPTELKRIINRGRSVEQSISLNFLDSLNKSLAVEIENIKNKTAVLNIDSSQINFAQNADDIKKVLALVSSHMSAENL